MYLLFETSCVASGCKSAAEKSMGLGLETLKSDISFHCI